MFLLFGIIQLFQQNVLIFQSNMLSCYLIREGTVKEIEQKKTKFQVKSYERSKFQLCAMDLDKSILQSLRTFLFHYEKYQLSCRFPGISLDQRAKGHFKRSYQSD